MKRHIAASMKALGLVSVLALVPVLSAACATDDAADECESDKDCRGDRVCEEGECVTPEENEPGATTSAPSTTTTPPPGDSCAQETEPCSAPSDCCGDSTGTATCVLFDGQGYCAHICAGGADCGSGCCAPLEQDSRSVCAPNEYCAGSGIGAPCDSDGECTSNMCAGGSGWCTAYCANSFECPGNNWCIQNAGGTNTCFPGCDTNADCAAFPGTSCQGVSTIDNMSHGVCST